MKTKQKSKSHGLFVSWVKKLFKYQALLVPFFVVLFVFCGEVQASCREGVMIYEIYGGGGNAGAIYNSDYVVLYNSTEREIFLDGWLLQYASSAGIFISEKTTVLSGILPKKGYYLVQQGNVGVIGKVLPDVDKVGAIKSNLAADKGRVALVHGTDVVNFENVELFTDFVAYEKGNNMKSIYRKNSSCLDSNNYAMDFDVHTPDPRNSLYINEENDSSDDEAGEDVCTGNLDDIILNEIFPNTEDEKNEFVEIKNVGTDCVDISGWAIKDSTNTSSHKTIFPEKTILGAGEYFYIEKNLYLNNDDDTVYLLDEAGLEMDKREYEKAVRGKSYSLIENEWIWTNAPTKGEENIFEGEETQPVDDSVVEPVSDVITEKKIYSNKIQITELFSNPFQSQYEEYVELFNGSAEDVDLLGWTLHDGSKTGKYTFPQSVILKAQEYLAIFKKDFKFALNNSGDESVTLFDLNGVEITKASYDGSKRNVSYNFDGARWRWSKFLTPGKENVLNNEPYGKVKIDEDIFKYVYADFSVSTGDVDGDKVKVTWDFGDGHKSYLAKTRHKYDQTGIFNGSVKLSDGSEDVVKTFIVEVKKYPHPKVRIIGVNANPIGSDTLGETLTIENKSKEKIDLNGWSIATGSKTLANHPIIEKFILKKKESKEITREISKFTLNNKKGKIELRYPDGEIADKVKYDRGKISIEEGEIYNKTESGWSWVATSQRSIKSVKQEETVDASSVISNQPASSADGQSNANAGNADAEVAGVETTKRKYSFVMLENNVVIGKMEFKNSNARVLGIESVREVNGKYFLTVQSKKQQHYAVTFFKNIFLVLNSKLNVLSNYFRT